MAGTALGEPRSADFVAGAALLVNLEVQVSWQVQCFVLSDAHSLTLTLPLSLTLTLPKDRAQGNGLAGWRKANQK